MSIFIVRIFGHPDRECLFLLPDTSEELLNISYFFIKTSNRPDVTISNDKKK